MGSCFPGDSDSKVSACNAISGLRRSPGGVHGNPLQYSCLENPRGQRRLVGYNPWGCKDSDTTEQLSTYIKGGKKSPSYTTSFNPNKEVKRQTGS